MVAQQTTLAAAVTIVDLPVGDSVTGLELVEAVQTTNNVGQSVQLSLSQIQAGIGVQAHTFTATQNFTTITTGDITAFPSLAPVSGGTSHGLKFSSQSNFGIFFGTGGPSISAGTGSLYLRNDGDPPATMLYVNIDGASTWTDFSKQAPTFVQGTSSDTPTGVGPVTLAYSNPVAVGDTLVCGIRLGSNVVTGITVSDNINGAWTIQQNVDLPPGPGDTLVIGYLLNSLAGTPTVTISWASLSITARLVIMEYTASSVDQLAFNNNLSGTSPSTASVTTIQGNEVLIAIAEADATPTWTSNAPGSNPSSGWVNRFNVASGKLIVDEVTVVPVGTYNETWSISPADIVDAGIITLRG